VTGIPGRNVVHQIMADRRVDQLRRRAATLTGAARGGRRHSRAG
jgi:hypothetical protein